MRLKQVKLSGFKSFCDPTTFELPGQLVGVVGPNGCGKSNIIDAARWVLGESRAAELRGESMQDVIFNGSSERKPASRASVEMVFDNTLGRVGGAWSGFAEISVKRVLTRDGQSTYHINQQVVRRKDVHDIFLGTGLGPRAYAIIGQGTISRIIEAKPDELRVFFEEAAGVSKYKERRRETESRLATTRENLTRVEDILRELNGQIEKLDQQAEVATQFRSFEAERADKQGWLWLIRRDDAHEEQQRLQRTAADIEVEIESLTARLRACEARLVEFREQTHQSTDEVSRRQAAYYEVNSRIAAIEGQIRMVAQNRSQLEERLAGLAAQIEGAQALAGSSAERLAEVDAEIETTEAERLEAEERAARAEAALAQARERDEQSREAVEQSRQALGQTQQARQVIEVRRLSVAEAIGSLRSRQGRLAVELEQLDAAPTEALERLAGELAAAREQEAVTAREQEALAAQGRDIEAQREPAQRQLQAAVGKRSTIEARIGVLSQLQSRMHSEQKVKPWLARHGISEDVERLWQRLTIEPGWELAVEAALRERVHSLEIADAGQLAKMLDDSPPGKLGLYLRDEVPPSAPAAPAAGAAAGARLTPLASMVRGGDAQLAGLLAEWLGNFFAAETAEAAFAARGDLPPGARFVVKGGHAIGRYDVSLFALDSDEDGVLARQQELQNLRRELRAQQLLTEEARQHAEQVEATATALTSRIAQAREAHARALRQASAAALEHERLAQAVSRHAATHDRLAGELDDLAAQLAAREEAANEAAQGLEQLGAELADRSAAAEAARQAAEATAQALAAASEESREAELALQGCSFAVRSAQQQAENLRQQIAMADENLARAVAEQERLQAELAALSDDEPREQRELLLQERMAAEEALAAARNRADELAGELRRLDEERLSLERNHDPLREKLTELKLKEQAARLTAEQASQALTEAEADEAGLAERLAALGQRPKPGWLQSEIGRLNQAIARLGPVNLAALDEVAAARERQAFLASQSADLFEAMTTLENAIRTIDQESRALLQQTYDTVNAEFGRLFPALFGGGEARLVLTGGEILDAGVQVIAQPPGKKNASIHLLSGGEKALTAIALVFAIFKLNPAPFCLLDEVDAPLDDANTERYCRMVQSMAAETQFLFITHNKIAMEMAEQLIGVTMQERGVSRLVAVDLLSAAKIGGGGLMAAGGPMAGPGRGAVMSTLSISLIALVVVVVVGVVLFNLWQSRGSDRQRALLGAGGRTGGGRHARDAMGSRTNTDEDGGIAAGVRGLAGRGRQPSEDFNDWTRQRREPTFTVEDDESPPPRAGSAHGMRAEPPAGSRRHLQDAPDPRAPATARPSAAAAIFPATAPGIQRGGRGGGGEAPPGAGTRPPDPGRQEAPGRLADGWEDDAEDLGPPEFEAPRLEPVPVEPPPPNTPTIRTGSFEETRPFEEPQPRTAGSGTGEIRGTAGETVGDTAGQGAAPTAGQSDARSGADDLPTRVDHVVTLIPRSPVNAERLIALTSSLRHVGSKPIRIEIDDGKGRWVPLQSGTMVGCLRCSVLLASRQGPLNAVELSDFSASVESLAAQIGARYVASDMNQVLREARELDAVAARLDTQVELGVEAAEPITPERLATVARKLDLYDRGGNRYACFAENGDLLYLMTPGATMDMIAFVLDVPRTAQSHDPWRSMVACASSCAQLVRGRVVDSAGRGMSVSMIETVGQQIARRYAELAEAGLKAGAPATLRVFN